MNSLVPPRSMDYRSRHRSKLLTEIIACAGFAVAFLYGLHRIRLGIWITDEGFYLACATRYALGDIPFRDEFSNPHRMFDILLWPLFRVYPDISVYTLRLLWLVFQLGCVIAFYRVFRRFAPNLLVALACLATIYLPNLVWTPAYHLMGTFFFLLSWALLFDGLLAQRPVVRIGLGIVSGVVFFLGAFSYLPLLAVTIVPAVALVILFGRRESAREIVGVLSAHLGSLVLLSLLTITVFGLFGVLGDWWEANNLMLTLGPYKDSPWQKLGRFGSEVLPHLYIAGAVALLVFSVVTVTRSSREIVRILRTPIGIGILALSTTGILLSLLFFFGVPEKKPVTFDAYTQSLRIVMIALGLHVGGLLSLLLRGSGEREPTWKQLYTMTLLGALIFGFFHGYLSGMAWKSMFAIIPLFVSGVVLVYRLMAGGAPQKPKTRLASAFVVAVCAAVGASSYLARVNYVFGASGPEEITDEYSIPRLAHIRANPQDLLPDLEAVVTYVEDRVDTGDFLLVDGHAPLLYYLTQTRPALDHSWTSVHIPSTVRRNSLRKMIESNRVPRYAVRFLIYRPTIQDGNPTVSQREHPIAAFIATHYTLEASFGVFEVWRLVGEPPDSVVPEPDEAE